MLAQIERRIKAYEGEIREKKIILEHQDQQITRKEKEEYEVKERYRILLEQKTKRIE